MNDNCISEQRKLADIAREVKHRVNRLLLTYAGLVLVTILIFLIIIATVCFLGYEMFATGRIYVRAFILLISVIIIAGICINVVLKPIFSIFVEKKKKRTAISRKDYPALFEMIDEVVTKVECLEPKNVYISDECNAYVCYTNMWGIFFNKKQDLTIGLPLLMTLNKTEFKAILCHEFGHFTQKSIKMNRIANLSEFICASIGRSSEEAENADDDSYAATARAFTRLATRIMYKQYLNVAPLNGILSRAQEFDADNHSYMEVGSDATISSLSKISFFSGIWEQSMNYLFNLMQEENRTPKSIKMIADVFVANANKKYNLGLTPNSHLRAPLTRHCSKISLANNNTHPSMNDRCNAIARKPVKQTKWDDTPALDYFNETTIDKIFNGIRPDILNFSIEDQTFSLKDDVTEEEVSKYADSLTPEYLDNFYCHPVFFGSDTYVDEKENHPEYESFPFTCENADILNEYFIAGNDLRTLQQIIDENSADRVFYYENSKYTGTNVPIQQHRDYYGPLSEKAIEIIRHCNWWMSRKADNDQNNSTLYNLMAASSATLNRTMELEEPIRTVYAILKSHDNTTKAKEYINDVDSYLRSAATYLMNIVSEGQSRFTIISGWLNVKDEIIANVVNYFANKTRDDDNKLVEVYSQFHGIIGRFRAEAWEQLKRIWIMPVIEGDTELQSVSESARGVHSGYVKSALPLTMASKSPNGTAD